VVRWRAANGAAGHPLDRANRCSVASPKSARILLSRCSALRACNKGLRVKVEFSQSEKPCAEGPPALWRPQSVFRNASQAQPLAEVFALRQVD
jgi:hypothetical protein